MCIVASRSATCCLLPHGNGVTYAYDSRDRRVTRTDALGQEERWAYDAMDRVVRYTDRRNRITTYAYDALGRSTTTTFPAMGGTLTASYDAGNRMVALADRLSGTLSWTYDSFDQVSAANSPQGTINYGYDAAGRRIRMQAASQAEVLYGYDNADRLTGITQGTEAVTFAYDNADRLVTQTLPNQVQTVYTYNNANQVTGLAWGKAGQTALGSLGYGYDNTGQLIAQTGTHAPQSLPQASNGNAFDDNNRQTKANNVDLAYDANGNLTSDGNRTYVWDDRERLSQIKQGDSVIASFSYDALRRRVEKNEASTTTKYLHDGLNVVQEVTGSTVNEVLTGLNVDQRYSRDDVSGRTYFLTDKLHSTRLLTDVGGSVVQRYDYDPYGVTSPADLKFSNPYQYAGREKDVSGLYYYRARYYRPEWKRFISEDPAGLMAGLNGYAYVNGRPTSHVDPLGLSAIGPVMTWVAADTSVPDPTDAAWPKWALYALAIGGALAIDNWMFNESDDSNSCPVPDTVRDHVTKGNTDIRNKSGNIDTANGDFDALGLKDISDKGKGVRVGSSDDGSTIIVRPSKDGRPTIEIQSGGRTRTKIRYGN